MFPKRQMTRNESTLHCYGVPYTYGQAGRSIVSWVTVPTVVCVQALLSALMVSGSGGRNRTYAVVPMEVEEEAPGSPAI